MSLKVIYAALRHDPCNPDLASGVDYNFYTAIQKSGMEVRIVGPFTRPGIFPERVIRKIYKRFGNGRWLKWDMSLVWESSRALSRMTREWRPDVIFTIFPAPLVFYNETVPCVFNTDTTFGGWQVGGAAFGQFPLTILTRWEGAAIRKSARVITFSDWCKQDIITFHHAEKEKVDVFPMPSALPAHVIPPASALEPPMPITVPLKLLLVGRDYKRKGIDIAIEVVRQLNAQGAPAELVVCGTQGQETEYVRFVGPYRKSVPNELEQYVNLYRSAHVLLHPALFEAAGIVPGEAAAFGVPTITNDTGGLATTVKDSISGIVLPKGSPAEAYVRVLREFLEQPEYYQEMRRRTRRRYEQELNWDVAGRQTVSILQEVAAAHNSTARV